MLNPLRIRQKKLYKGEIETLRKVVLLCYLKYKITKEVTFSDYAALRWPQSFG